MTLSHQKLYVSSNRESLIRVRRSPIPKKKKNSKEKGGKSKEKKKKDKKKKDKKCKKTKKNCKKSSSEEEEDDDDENEVMTTTQEPSSRYDMNSKSFIDMYRGHGLMYKMSILNIFLIYLSYL